MVTHAFFGIFFEFTFLGKTTRHARGAALRLRATVARCQLM